MKILLDKKKIGFFCLQLSRGGSERVTSILANYFNERGYFVTVVTLEKSPIDYYIASNVELVCLSERKGKHKSNYIYKIRKLKTIIDDLDIFIVMNNRPIFLSALCPNSKVKKIYAERNDPRKVPENVVKRIIRNIAFKSADGYVFQTADQAKYYGQQIRKKGKVILNPISSDLPCRDYSKDNKRIISVCRYDKQKNIKMSIDAFKIFVKQHHDYILEIYGRGPEKELLQQYINSLGMQDRIFLNDYRSDIYDVMAEATIFVLSSNYEGISNSMIEAMGIGLPVICTDCPVGGARMLIKHGINGFLVDIGDATQMAYYLRYITENKGVYETIGCNAKKIRDELSISKICAQWHEYIEYILAND